MYITNGILYRHFFLTNQSISPTTIRNGQEKTYKYTPVHFKVRISVCVNLYDNRPTPNTLGIPNMYAIPTNYAYSYQTSDRLNLTYRTIALLHSTKFLGSSPVNLDIILYI